MVMKELGIDTWPHDKLRALRDEIEGSAADGGNRIATRTSKNLFSKQR